MLLKYCGIYMHKLPKPYKNVTSLDTLYFFVSYISQKK